jgi:hypothetical protein
MQIDLRVLAFALVVTISTGVLFGLWPAVGASRLRLRDALQESGDTTFTGSGRLNRMLVVTQVALACLLTIGAALMLTTLRALLTIDVGMRIDRVAAARLDLPTARYGTAPARADFVQSVLERLRSAPGVEEAAAINTLPLAGEPGVGYRVDPEGGRTAEWISSPFLVVSPGYFRAMGIPLVRGRDLAWTDSEDSQAAVINRTLAQRLWPGEDAVGKQFTMAGLRTVVGSSRSRSRPSVHRCTCRFRTSRKTMWRLWREVPTRSTCARCRRRSATPCARSIRRCPSTPRSRWRRSLQRP